MVERNEYASRLAKHFIWDKELTPLKSLFPITDSFISLNSDYGLCGCLRSNSEMI